LPFPEFAMTIAPLLDASLEAWKVAYARQLIETVPFHQWAGLRLIELAPGLCRLDFVATGAVLVIGDYVHGGVLNGLLEPPAYGALITQLNEGETAVTIDIHVQHLRAIPADARVELTGRIARRGRGVAFLESEARVDGVLCTQARITKSISPPP